MSTPYSIQLPIRHKKTIERARRKIAKMQVIEDKIIANLTKQLSLSPHGEDIVWDVVVNDCPIALAMIEFV